MTRLAVLPALLLALGACSPATGPASGSTDASSYRLAVDNPARSAEDRERDALRRPAEVLEFLQIGPGMTVLDLFSGAGYYTELLSYLVGSEGAVTAHSNLAYQGFAGSEASRRYANQRLPNVSVMIAENNELDLEVGHYDAILMVLSYHDIYYVDAANGWQRIDGPQLLRELYEALKPGGILGIIDHYAAAGSPPETGGTTHRIDPAIVIREVRSAGFRLDAQSDLLRNAGDDYSRSVFEPDLRGRTDRFVLRFRKPG